MGVLGRARPDDLAAHAIAALVERTGIAGDRVDDVQWGAANQAGEDNRNVARMAALLAGLPVTVPGATVNRLCGSGLEAVNCAYRAVRTDEGDVMIAGGSESMTRAPFVMAKAERAFERRGRGVVTALGGRFVNPRLAERYGTENMGETAENVASDYEIPRRRQDEFALESHRRALAAMEEGRFKDEIVAVEVPRPKQDPLVVDSDEGPR